MSCRQPGWYIFIILFFTKYGTRLYRILPGPDKKPSGTCDVQKPEASFPSLQGLAKWKMVFVVFWTLLMYSRFTVGWCLHVGRVQTGWNWAAHLWYGPSFRGIPSPNYQRSTAFYLLCFVFFIYQRILEFGRLPPHLLPRTKIQPPHLQTGLNDPPDL